MANFLLDECYGPVLLCLTLFVPIVLGVLAIPLAVICPPARWWIIALLAVDYIVPLGKKPWACYHDLCIKPLAVSFRRYFRYGMNVSPEFRINPERRYLFCAHPHGIFGFYVVIVMDYLLTHGVRMRSFAAPMLTILPIARRHFSWIGLTSADAPNMRRSLKSNYPNNVFWSTPGGVEELFCVPDPDEQIVIFKRKGFCKIALQCGVDLVPVYGFGNNQMFPVMSGRKSLLAKLSKKLNVTIMLWLGRFNMPYSFLPVKHPQLVVVGAPIPVEQCSDPSKEQIEELHQKYCIAIRQLFDKHKTDPILEKHGFANTKLYFENER